MGETTALRVVGYYNELAGFIDSYYPGRAVREDVNGGEKSGARVALLIQPSENVSITPRMKDVIGTRRVPRGPEIEIAASRAVSVLTQSAAGSA